MNIFATSAKIYIFHILIWKKQNVERPNIKCDLCGEEQVLSAKTTDENVLIAKKCQVNSKGEKNGYESIFKKMRQL